MFGLSTWEILIILAVALIFVGPDQLPKVARQIGKGVRQVRGAVGKVDDEMRRAVREAAAEFDDDGNPVAPRTPPPTPPPTPAPAPDPAAPVDPVDPVLANAPPQERDWSQVGKSPVSGAVGRATAQPARPVAPIAPDPATPPVPATAVDLSKPATETSDGTSTS